MRKICRNRTGKEPERQPKNAHPNRPKWPRRNRYSVRTDSGPIALRAVWSMHVEAMNWSGMGHAEYAAALGLSPHALRIWRDRLEQSGNEMDWRSLLHPSARAQLSSAANCARCKYRLTPQEADGRSNRRRFSDEQKRAMVQETERPGVSVAEVCRRHGIATSWRAAKSIRLNSTSSSHLESSNRATRHDLLSVVAERSASSAPRPSRQMVHVSPHVSCVHRRRVGGAERQHAGVRSAGDARPGGRRPRAFPGRKRHLGRRRNRRAAPGCPRARVASEKQTCPAFPWKGADLPPNFHPAAIRVSAYLPAVRQ